MKSFAAIASFVGLAAAEILWDGRFNDLTSATDLDKWSWSNQVGPYQYYIHGDGEVTEYVNLAAANANPADGGSSKGAKISLTDTAYWNGQTMRRTELIPQTSAAIAAGKVFYHFSIKREAENAPSLAREHQIAFFESHFTELKSGLISGASGTEDTSLQWFVGGTSKWEVEWEAGVWHNIAYEIDFSGETVGLWHSTGGSDLKQVVAPITASTSSNGADWHVGVLELPNGDADTNEDFYFSGVYIEDGDITASFSGGSAGGDDTSASSSAVASVATSATKAATTAPAATTKAAVTTTSKAAVATTSLAADVTTLLTKTTSAAAEVSTAQTTSIAQTSSAAPVIPVAETTSTPVEVAPTQTSALAVETPTQTSRCKLTRRSRHRRSIRSQ